MTRICTLKLRDTSEEMTMGLLDWLTGKNLVAFLQSQMSSDAQ